MRVTCKSRIHVMALCSIAILSTSVTGCYNTVERGELPPPLVTIAEAEQRSIPLFKEYTGKTDAVETVDTVARVRGYLEKTFFTPGQIVQKGEPLFLIEQTQYLAAMKRAEAQLETEKARLEYAKADHARSRELYEKATIPLDELEMKIRNLQQAHAAVKAAEAALIDAELNVQYTDIRAPISGMISRDYISKGNLVSEQTGKLATIRNMDPIHVYFEVTDNDFAEFQKIYGEPKKLASSIPEESPWKFHLQLLRQSNGKEIDSPTDVESYPFEGRITHVDNTIKPSVGSVLVRGEIPNPDYTIYPGWVCRVRIPARTIPGAVVVQEKAVSVDLHSNYMFILDENDQVQRRVVKKGLGVGTNECIIESGIEPGDRYIVDGLQKVRVGSGVTIKNTDGNLANNHKMANSDRTE